MPEPAFTFVIRPAQVSDLQVLEHEFSPGTLSKPHYRRYEVQKRGEGLYLIAWHEHTPVGHFVLRWSGPDDETITKYVDVTHSAFLEAGATQVNYRRKGIATALIREAERLAKAHGCIRIGLCVGSTDNPEAKRLYEHLGFVDWGQGAFLISWEYLDSSGIQQTESELVTYLSKSL
jgi:GNAT superfamily N-acetyltransferase